MMNSNDNYLPGVGIERKRSARKGFSALRIFLTLFAMLAVSAQGVFSEGSAAPEAPDAWTIYVVDAPQNVTNMTDRSLGYRPSDGAPCVAYGGDHLYYSCYVSGGWSTTIVDPSMSVGEYAALDYNSFSWPFISYYDAANGALKLAYHNGLGWQISTVDTPPPLVGEAASPQEHEGPTFDEQLLDSIQPWRKLFSQGLDPDAAISATDAVEGVGRWTSIAIDNVDNVHISYYDEVNRSLRYAFWDGVTWIKEVAYDYLDQGGAGKWSSIALDSRRWVHISFMSEKYDDLMFGIRNQSGDWEFWREETLNNRGACTSIALDSDDEPHISYIDFGNHTLRHAIINDSGDLVSEQVPGAGEVGGYTSIAIGANDHPYISYYESNDKALRMARERSTGWTIQEVDNTGDSGLFTSIAFNPAGNPSIAFYNTSLGAYQFVAFNGSVWGPPSTIATGGDVGWSTSLVLNADGVPFISYYDVARGYLKYARAYGTSFYKTVLAGTPAGAFSSIDLITPQGPRILFYEGTRDNLRNTFWNSIVWKFYDTAYKYDVGQFVSQEIGTDSQSFVSYYDATNRDLIFAYGSNSTWISDTLDTSGDVGLYTSIALTPGNVPYVSYYDATNADLKLRHKTGIGSWALPVVVDSAGQVGLYTSIALDSANNPHIAYYDAGNFDLKYAYFDGTWHTETVDSVGAVGKYASLAIDPADNSRHICYYDETNGDLKVANWTGGPWTFELVDTVGDVGQFCSIALDSAGNPAISYYDVSNGDLKLALSNSTLPDAEIYIPLVHNNYP